MYAKEVVSEYIQVKISQYTYTYTHGTVSVVMKYEKCVRNNGKICIYMRGGNRCVCAVVI